MKTTCPYCGVGCGINAQTDNGAIEVLEGDKDHPANLGRLCVKGASVHETLQSGGRLLYPYYKGVRIGWQQALDQVVEGFKRTIAEHGPDSVAFYLSGQLLTEDYYVANKLMKGFIGSANLDTNSRLCMASAVAGYKRAFGSDTVPCNYEDLELADLIVLVGSNPAWAHPILFQRIKAAKAANSKMRVVVVDPRRTASCDIADLHVAIKPGSDTRLFNGLLCWLAQQHHLDSDFITNHTNAFTDALQIAQQQFDSLSQLALDIAVEESDLLQLYQWFADTERTISFYSMGVNQSVSGVDNSNAIINCHLATGRIGKPGMGPFSITGQPNAMGGREVGGLANQLAAHMDFDDEAVDRVARFWQAPAIARKPGLKAVDLFQAIERGDVKAVWIMGTNPVVSMPDADQVVRALKACPLVVVSDCVASTDTGQYADYLLPATGWSEKNGMVTNSERRISRQRGLLPPSGEARHDWQIICDFAAGLGYGAAFAYTHQFEIFAEHARLSGFENNGSRDFDISAYSQITAQQYDDFTPIQWPVNTHAPQGTARMFTDGRFYTGNSRANFIPIHCRSPEQQPDKSHPFVMNTGRIRDHWHTMTRTGQATRLFKHKAEPYVEINPSDAKGCGIQSNDLVELSNERGCYRARAQLTDQQSVGELFVPMHWTEQFTGQGRMGTLLAPATDAGSGQPELKHAAVALRKLAVRWQAFLLTRHALSDSQLESLESGYWARVPQQYCTGYYLAGERAESGWYQWCKQRLSAPSLFYLDNETGQCRAVGFDSGRLDWVLLVLPFSQMPDAEWLDNQFSKRTLDIDSRRQLLSACAADAQPKGSIVCSCFEVGERQIKQAIQQGADSAESLGQQLKCGTNCGSCLPELNALIAIELPTTSQLG